MAPNDRPKEAELIPITKLADELGVSSRSIHRWIVKGTFPIPYLEAGSGIVVTRKAFDTWLDKASRELPMSKDLRATSVAMYSNYLDKCREANG